MTDQFASYMLVVWRHDHADEPVRLYSELDDDRFEVRKVEVYADGHADYAGPGACTGTTRLGTVPTPQVEEISAQPEFTATAIAAADFEATWTRAQAQHS